MRITPSNAWTWALIVAAFGQQTFAGTISGRRQGPFGDGVHYSWVWFTGVGSNPTNAWAAALTWGGDFSAANVPAGQYWCAADEAGPYRHLVGSLVTVPASGTVDVQIHDPLTMTGPGLTDLYRCDWAAQEFVATGTDVARVMSLSPNDGSQVWVSIRDDNPWGPQIGPARLVTNGALSPYYADWAIGEVPTIPGRRYVVRLDREGTGYWRPSVSYRFDPYPNGGAWFDGVYRPEADLRTTVAARDDGLFDEYNVSNWWRANTFTELVQTFLPQGQELRVATFLLAGQSSCVMRASLHQWAGSYPPGPQIGAAKHAEMVGDFNRAFVWGPGEALVTPGVRHALRFARVDGQPFAIYGNEDNYDAGEAYFDGAPDNGIDMTGVFITREADHGNIVVSNLSFTPISATQVRATFTTDVPTTATVVYRTGSPIFDNIVPADAVQKTSHDIVVSYLAAGTSYQMSVLAHHPSRNMLRSSPTVVAMPVTSAAFSGHVHSQVGPVANALVMLEDIGRSTTTNSAGNFTLTNVPTGRHTLRVEAVAHGTATDQVDVTPDGQARAEVTLTAHTNLLAGSDGNPIAGWTEFGDFDGQYFTGQYNVYARTGSWWIGTVVNGGGGKNGGVYRVVSTEPGREYTYAGWVLTDAYGASEDPVPGLAVARLGVDPTGGTDPAGPNVIWGRYRFTAHQWKEIAVPFTATGTQATLFAQHKYETYYVLAPWWIAAFDDLWVGLRRNGIPDLDRDGDVDQEDFGFLQACLTGPGNRQDQPACAACLLDRDNDVDPDDLLIFQNCAAGAGVPYSPSCAD